jgi:hypothetical protein
MKEVNFSSSRTDFGCHNSSSLAHLFCLCESVHSRVAYDFVVSDFTVVP